jgi:integrase
VARPAINRQEGTTLAFPKVQARKLLDLPAEETIVGLRDRAILSVGLQVGLRRAEIAALKVGDLHQNRGYDSLRVTRKGGRRDALAINPQTAARLRAYLETAGHAGDSEGPMFRPLKHNGKQDEGTDRPACDAASGFSDSPTTPADDDEQQAQPGEEHQPAPRLGHTRRVLDDIDGAIGVEAGNVEAGLVGREAVSRKE